MTHGLSNDIRCHVCLYSFLCLHITKLDIRPQVKWAVSLVIADGHFNLHQKAQDLKIRFSWIGLIRKT